MTHSCHPSISQRASCVVTLHSAFSVFKRFKLQYCYDCYLTVQSSTPLFSVYPPQLGCICSGYSPQHKGRKPSWSALWGPLLLHQNNGVSLHCNHRVKSSNSVKHPFIHITMNWSYLKHHTKVAHVFYFLDWPSCNWRGWMTARRAGLISTVSIGCSAAKRLPYQVLCHHGSLIVLDSDRRKCAHM